MLEILEIAFQRDVGAATGGAFRVERAGHEISAEPQEVVIRARAVERAKTQHAHFAGAILGVKNGVAVAESSRLSACRGQDHVVEKGP